MPHNKSIFSKEKCHPPAEWLTYRATPEPEPVLVAPEPEPWAPPCGQDECGQPRGKGSKPPRAWIGVTRQGDWGKTVWLCSPDCVNVWLADPDAKPHPPAQTTATALAALNRLAGVHLSVMTATPVRVQRALDAAFARLVEEVAYTAEMDGRRRPTTVDLLAELGVEETA